MVLNAAMPDTARGRFEIFVRPSLKEWTDEPDDLRRATTLAGHINDCAERLCRHDTGGTPSKDTLAEFRRGLASRCPEFGIIRDVGDGGKHVELDRGSRKVSHQGQTQRTGSFSRGFSDGFDVTRMIVTDDFGVVHEFDELVPAVVSCIEQELAMRGL